MSFNVTRFILCILFRRALLETMSGNPTIWNCKVQPTPGKPALTKFCNMNGPITQFRTKTSQLLYGSSYEGKQSKRIQQWYFKEFCCKVSLLVNKISKCSGYGKGNFYFKKWQ